ncbi:hypothetical protein PG995_013163 [Apiospora arundinis]
MRRGRLEPHHLGRNHPADDALGHPLDPAPTAAPLAAGVFVDEGVDGRGAHGRRRDLGQLLAPRPGLLAQPERRDAARLERRPRRHLPPVRDLGLGRAHVVAVPVLRALLVFAAASRSPVVVVALGPASSVAAAAARGSRVDAAAAAAVRVRGRAGAPTI